MINRGIATFALDYGKCPRWLFERMVKLSRGVIYEIINEYGPDEFIKRISDPVWFQSLGTVAAFDWNSSGLTTILTAALKEAIRGQEKSLGIFICGGKGKTSRKTPDEIKQWGNILALPDENVNNLVYNSKMAAKVDSGLIQDGFQIYHHTFFFSQSGAWSVVQQGMNTKNLTARRYHWYSKNISDLINEPHSGIISQLKEKNVLNLTSAKSSKNREVSLELLQNGIDTRKKQADITLEQSKKFSEELIKKYPDVFKMRDGKLVRDFSKYEKVSMEDKTLAARIIILQGVIKDVMDESVVFLKGILDKCKAPGTTNVLCIETFVNAAHNKGPYIPIGCGLPYPEYGEDISENKEERINVVGRLMAKETVDALDCIHNRKVI